MRRPTRAHGSTSGRQAATASRDGSRGARDAAIPTHDVAPRRLATAAAVARRLRRHHRRSPRRRSAERRARRRQAAEHKPVTIVVGACGPGGPRRRSTPSTPRSPSSRRSTPGHRVEPTSTTGRRRRSPRCSPAARCRTCSRSRSPTASRSSSRARSRTSRPRPRAALRRQVQPQRPRQRPGRRGHDLRRPDRGLRHVAAVQPPAVQAGRPRPRQAAHDVGRGPRRGQGHRREDRRRPATPDGHENTGGWQPTDVDLRPRRPDGGGRRGRQRHLDRQQPRDQGRPRVPQGPPLGGRLAWAPTSTTTGAPCNQAFAAGQIGMYTGAPTSTPPGPEPSIKPDDYGLDDDPARRTTRTPACSAAATSPRSTSSPTEAERERPSTGSTSTTCRSC